VTSKPQYPPEDFLKTSSASETLILEHPTFEVIGTSGRSPGALLAKFDFFQAFVPM
jgi:hypothetical protein